MIKVISYGKKGNTKTAEIVVKFKAYSLTVHVWQSRVHSNTYVDWAGNKYEL